ncbi:hypothetical protein HKX48_005125 [Thoreauomyces humboldtii]|nr:hypothetical protein HKX48_005125 [Thoreauomyces humboldtii]
MTLWCLGQAAFAGSVTVYAPIGPISGVSRSTGEFAFLGVRFGDASRWSPPTAPAAWSTPVEAYEFQQSCPQVCQSVLCPERIGEDCLFLNIYAPSTTILTTTAGGVATGTLLPVILFFHGGSFEVGGAGMTAYDAGELAQALAVVVVTFNYRLSVFGFFDISSLNGSSTTSTNFGILDQRLAIQWVQTNIAAFGGNPSDVTFMGQSAGAQSILLHMVHPSTTAYIKKAILMSPPALALTTPSQALDKAATVAAKLGCTSAACLLGKSMREVLNAKVDTGASEMDVLSKLVYRAMAPVVDGVDVLMSPFDAIKHAGDAKIMLGSVSNETSLFVNEAIPADLSSSYFNVIVCVISFVKRLEFVMSDSMSPEKGFSHRMTKASEMSMQAMHRDFSEIAVRAAGSSSSIWTYMLEAPWLGGADEPVGDICGTYACHTTDLSYLFMSPGDAASEAATTSLRAYVSAFIAGSTTLQPTELPEWIPATTSLLSFPILRFPDPSKVSGPYVPVLASTHPRTAQCNVWDTAGYPYAPISDPATVTRNKKASAGLPVPVLIVTLSVLVLFVVLEWLCVFRGFVLRRRLLRLVAAIDREERDMAIAVQKLHGTKKLMDDPKQIGLVDKLANAVSMSLDGMSEEKPDPVLVECRSVTYHAGDIPGAKRLLDSVDVACLPGTVTAIMGPSGAGKTTLLSLLNRRSKASSNVEDRILFAGKPLSSISAAKFRALTGFVAQHDAPYFGLTVREVMMFNAMLELPPSMSHVDKVRRINRQLRQLNLLPCADVVIQKPESNQGGISGGQMRRLSIAVALLKRPSVLFMDEPTSGLDAKSSLDVGKAMTQLARQGYTIICSIHQPRPEMFAMFHQVVVLVYGRLLFSGLPELSVEYFQDLRARLQDRGHTNASKAVHELDTAKETGIDSEEDTSEEISETGDRPNPADLVLDVASTIGVAEVGWASRQWQPADTGVDDILLEAAEKHRPTPTALTISPVEDWKPDSVAATLQNGRNLMSAALAIAERYTAVEHGQVVVPLGARRFSEPMLYTAAQKRHTEFGNPIVPGLDSFDRLESGGSREPVDRPQGQSTGGLFSTPVDAVDKMDGGGGKKVVLARLSLPWQVLVVTGRWWATRPVARKFNMMIISACGVWILSILQRRSGDDVLSLVLQTKGLALACIGLPALKNIHISFDYYEDRDIYNFDSQNGTVTALAFFLHRVIYETANATIEGFIAVISAYFILGCNSDPVRIGTAMCLFVAYYNCTTTLFTLVYCTRLGRPEARSVAFFSQAVLAIVSGVWIKKGDATVYDWIAWAQYLNPTYWALSPLVRANLASAGECLLDDAGYCQATMGDVVAEEARADRIAPREGMLALGVIWLVMRGLQLLLLYRDTYWSAFWTATRKSWADWVKVQTTEGRGTSVQITQTGDSLEQMPDLFPVGTKGNMVERDLAGL